jgi:hypothetical protein
MGNKKTKQETKSSSSTSLNDWSKNLFEGGMSNIMGTIDKFNTNTPYKPYTGSMVADLSGGERRAREYASTNLGSTAGMFGDAQNAIKTGMASEWNPEQVTSTDVAGASMVNSTQVAGPRAVNSTQVAGPREVAYRQYNSGDEAKFMNPYKSQVVDATSAYMDETRNREMMQNQARATQSGAFGGSRHGVADAELMRTASMDKAGMLADLNYRGFNDSMDRFERESGAVYGANVRNSDVDYGARRDNAVRDYNANIRNSDVAYASERDNAVRYDDMALRNSDVAYSSARDNAVRRDDTSRFNVGRNDSAAQYRADQQFRGAGMLSDLAGRQQDSWMQEANFMNQLGMGERDIENAKLLAERAKYDDQAAEEWKRFQIELQTRIGLLGATPLLTNTTGTGSNTTSESGMSWADVGSILQGVGSIATMGVPKPPVK